MTNASTKGSRSCVALFPAKISGVVLLFAGATVACISKTDTESLDTPKIVEVFACSDYCPGPEEEYIKRVYDGVTDEKECRELGGKLYMIAGWGKRTVCEVQ